MQFHPYTTFIIHVPTPVFVYDEVWLHELVPQHACCANFNLNISLDESTLVEPISNSTQTCSNTILQHVEEDTTHVPTTCIPHPQLSNNCTENNQHPETSSKHNVSKISKHEPFIHLSEKELLTQLFTTLSQRNKVSILCMPCP